MLSKPRSITRTTLDSMDNLPHVGIYLLAYLGKVVYVGKAEESVANRIKQHYTSYDESLCVWMRKLETDWCNVRLDVLEPPDTGDVHSWLKATEAALIRYHRPLFNEQVNT